MTLVEKLRAFGSPYNAAHPSDMRRALREAAARVEELEREIAAIRALAQGEEGTR